MPCYSPLTGYRSRSVNASGKRSIVFSAEEGFTDLPVTVPCGHCLGCRLERSRQWAVRCMHEAQMHRDNCFITLTYDDKHLPEGRTLVKPDLQLFFKRLRGRIAPVRILYYACGEYGDDKARPHYHACIFGFDFPDKRFYKKTRLGFDLFTSAILSSLWPYGFATVGACSFDTAAYCARYVVKKVFGDDALAHYGGREPEFCLMSLKPPVGRSWFDRFGFEVEQNDSVVMLSREMRPPSYYDKLREGKDALAFRRLKRERKRKALKFAWNSSPDRLAVRSEVAEARLRLRRSALDDK